MDQLGSQFKDLPDGFIALVLTDAEEMLKTNITILKELTKQDHIGLYITVNQPYKRLLQLLDNNKIPTDRMFFIDCVTRMAGGTSKRENNCIFIASPSGLTELGIAISQALESFPDKKKYIYMDALSTLIIYNTAGSIAKFSHFIMSKIKILGVSGVFIAARKEVDEQLIAQIAQFCDKVIRT
ncbi:MAG: hypothetical protein ISS93_02015 [Candidatus Aenigmarchaeota archaeon]|nr:hypothetical protein [Candidatus Aenigmarchaeota archaeon]